MMDKIWGQACADLEQSVGPNNYNHWIKPLRLTAIDDGAARFVSPTRFISDWVGRHFAKDIMAVLTRHVSPADFTASIAHVFPEGGASVEERGDEAIRQASSVTAADADAGGSATPWVLALLAATAAGFGLGWQMRRNDA